MLILVVLHTNISVCLPILAWIINLAILVLFQGMHTEMHSTPAIKSLGLSEMIWWGCKWGHWGVKDHFQSIKFGIRKKWGTKALVTCKKIFEKWILLLGAHPKLNLGFIHFHIKLSENSTQLFWP